MIVRSLILRSLAISDSMSLVGKQRKIRRLLGLADIDQHGFGALRRNDRAREPFDDMDGLHKIRRRGPRTDQPVSLGNDGLKLQINFGVPTAKLFC
jgi:hypothetical protein